MHIRILGSAAGGRFPQWNCGCAHCAALRRGTFPGKPRTQSQLALSADSSNWFLAGACPDLPAQIENFSELHPAALRRSPIAGVVLANADLDHVLGLLLLRELQPLRVYAAPSILHILREENSVFGMLNRADPQVEWNPMTAGSLFPLLTPAAQDCGLRCEAVFLSNRYPRYVKHPPIDGNQATAALFFESAHRKRIAYLPAVAELTETLLARMRHLDLLFFDGTFWSNDELIRVQGSGETARQMGHLPVEDTLRLLRNLDAGRKIFIHINNTNPILNTESPEYRAVRAAGWEVAEDGWQFNL